MKAPKYFHSMVVHTPARSHNNLSTINEFSNKMYNSGMLREKKKKKRASAHVLHKLGSEFGASELLRDSHKPKKCKISGVYKIRKSFSSRVFKFMKCISSGISHV
ncbi:hypothetical protein Droror1_Dr00013498 [Drosera rotundifolia]